MKNQRPENNQSTPQAKKRSRFSRSSELMWIEIKIMWTGIDTGKLTSGLSRPQKHKHARTAPCDSSQMC